MMDNTLCALPKLLSFLFAFLGISLHVEGQSLGYQIEAEGHPVRNSKGDLLPYAWAGGINSAQIARVEVNADGLEDIVLFDRYSLRALVFIQGADSLHWDPVLSQKLTNRIDGWALFYDFTGDGRADLFTSHPQGGQVFQNTLDDGEVSWRLISTENGTAYLQAESSSGISNIQMSRFDVPGVIDGDQDGDLDLWVFNFATGQSINYLENTSIDLHGRADALTFRRESNFWGSVSSCACNLTKLDGTSCRPARTEHVGAKSLLMLEGNGNGPDAIFGDEACNNLTWLQNLGTAKSPALDTGMIGNLFPNLQPLTFSAAYQLSANELVISSNLHEDPLREVDFSRSVRLYRRSSNAWVLQTPSWLQEDMMDVGSHAAPTFADLDADGDLDLLVAQGGLGSALSLYKNEGTATQPLYQQGPSYTPSPALIDWQAWVLDVTGDGKQEVVMAGRDPGRVAYQFFYATPNSSGELLAWQPWNFPLFARESVAFGELTGDGRIDALVGHPSGRIRLFEYKGDLSTPTWQETEPIYKGLDNSTERNLPRLQLGDVNGDDQLDLLVLAQGGGITYFDNIADAIKAQGEHLLDAKNNPLLVPTESHVALLPSALDVPPQLVVGLPTGGLWLLDPLFSIPPPELPTWMVYPNPTAGQVKVLSAQPGTVQVLSLQGQVLHFLPIVAQTPTELSLDALPSGGYFFRIIWQNGRSQSRLVLRQP